MSSHSYTNKYTSFCTTIQQEQQQQQCSHNIILIQVYKCNMPQCLTIETLYAIATQQFIVQTNQGILLVKQKGIKIISPGVQSYRKQYHQHCNLYCHSIGCYTYIMFVLLGEAVNIIIMGLVIIHIIIISISGIDGFFGEGLN